MSFFFHVTHVQNTDLSINSVNKNYNLRFYGGSTKFLLNLENEEWIYFEKKETHYVSAQNMTFYIFDDKSAELHLNDSKVFFGNLIKIYPLENNFCQIL